MLYCETALQLLARITRYLYLNELLIFRMIGYLFLSIFF